MIKQKLLSMKEEHVSNQTMGHFLKIEILSD